MLVAQILQSRGKADNAAQGVSAIASTGAVVPTVIAIVVVGVVGVIAGIIYYKHRKSKPKPGYVY